MRKKTVLILWVIGFVIALIGAGMFVPAIVAAANHCTTNAFGGQNCSLPTSDPLTAIGLIGVVALIIGGLVSTIAWIGALIRSAKMQTWAWFVIILLFHALGTLIYVLAGPSEQPATIGTGVASAPPR